MRSFAEQVTGSWPPESQTEQQAPLLARLRVAKSALWYNDHWKQEN